MQKKGNDNTGIDFMMGMVDTIPMPSFGDSENIEAEQAGNKQMVTYAPAESKPRKKKEKRSTSNDSVSGPSQSQIQRLKIQSRTFGKFKAVKMAFEMSESKVITNTDFLELLLETFVCANASSNAILNEILKLKNK